MVEIKFRDQFEIADLAGKTISEAREQFRDEFGIPVKAHAKLNGEVVKGSAETDTVLTDGDKLSFAVSRPVGLYLVGVAILALVITGSTFAFGFINASTSLNATSVNSNFAEVTADTAGSANVTWNAFGFFKGSIGGPNIIFHVDPAAGYNGDLVTTVTLGNADELAKRYRVLALKLQMVATSTGATLDINADGSASDVDDWVMLTLDNGSVSMFTAGTTNMSVCIKSGFYVTHVYPAIGWSGSATPDLFCEVAQR